MDIALSRSLFVYVTARKSTKVQTLGAVALHATTWPAQMMQALFKARLCVCVLATSFANAFGQKCCISAFRPLPWSHALSLHDEGVFAHCYFLLSLRYTGTTLRVASLVWLVRLLSERHSTLAVVFHHNAVYSL